MKHAIGETLPQNVGRLVYRTTFNLPKAEQFLLAKQHLTKDYNRAMALSDKLHGNISQEFGGHKPKSTFYTWFRPQGLLVVETGEERLHDYLRDTFNYEARIQQFGAEVRSGHFCDGIRFSSAETLPVALFDSLTSTGIVLPQDPEYLMTVTLAQHGILPLTEDGYVPQVIFANSQQP